MSHKVSVVIGRFSPVHLAHLELFKEACENSDELVIVIGSSYQAPNTKNPWSCYDRDKTIDAAINEVLDLGDFPISYIYASDYLYDEQKWVDETKRYVEFIIDKDNDITLFGHHSDSSSYYLDKFSEWKYQEVPTKLEDLHATYIRHFLFSNKHITSDTVAKSTEKFLRDWMLTDDYTRLSTEYNLETTIKIDSSNMTHPPIHSTVDAVVIHTNSVLLITRKGVAGTGLYALPGGYFDIGDSTLFSASLRELREETGLDLSNTKCDTHPNFPGIFDARDRSRRGRIISHVFKWSLDDTINISDITAQDDAQSTFWLPLDELEENKSKFFEDHLDIIKIMTNKD